MPASPAARRLAMVMRKTRSARDFFLGGGVQRFQPYCPGYWGPPYCGGYGGPPYCCGYWGSPYCWRYCGAPYCPAYGGGSGGAPCCCGYCGGSGGILPGTGFNVPPFHQGILHAKAPAIMWWGTRAWRVYLQQANMPSEVFRGSQRGVLVSRLPRHALRRHGLCGGMVKRRRHWMTAGHAGRW